METASTAMEMQTSPRPWWLMLIDGIALAIIGAILLWARFPAKVEAYMFLVTVLGIWWIVRGIMDIMFIFVDSSAWGWKLIMGIISLIAGAYILMYPVVSAAVLPRIGVLVLGLWGVLSGVIMLLLAFRGGGWGAGILGAIEVVIGIILMANYTSAGSGLAFLWTAALFALIGGIVLIVQSFRLRTAAMPARAPAKAAR